MSNKFATATLKLYDDKFESMVRGKKLADISKEVIHSIQEERIEQYLKWGGPKHDDEHNSHDWMAYIVKQLGRAAMEQWDVAYFRKTMVRVAALAVAAIEWSDRRK